MTHDPAGSFAQFRVLPLTPGLLPPPAPGHHLPSLGLPRLAVGDRCGPRASGLEPSRLGFFLPLFGLVAAGAPFDAVAGDDELAVPAHLLRGRPGEQFVLRVVGSSMTGEGIYDGDLVVVERRESAAAGEMVVALVAGEVTLKRFFPEGETVRLEPANPELEALRVPASEVRVQGVVVGLMRKY